MNTRSRSACGDSATISGILHVTHITLRSIAGSDARGVVERVVAGAVAVDSVVAIGGIAARVGAGARTIAPG